MTFRHRSLSMECSSGIICIPQANIGKTYRWKTCIVFIKLTVTLILISFIDESRKIKAVTRTSSYRRKGKQTFMFHLFGSIWEFLVSNWAHKKLPYNHMIWPNLIKKNCFRGLPEGRRRLSTEQLQQMTKNYRVPSKNCQWIIFLALKRWVLRLKFWWYLEWLNR